MNKHILEVIDKTFLLIYILSILLIFNSCSHEGPIDTLLFDDAIALDKYTNGFTITSPNGGEIWAENSKQTITFEPSGDHDCNVGHYGYSGNSNMCQATVFLSVDNGTNWKELHPSSSSFTIYEEKAYEWTIPKIYITNSQCLIKIQDDMFSDISDSNFTIVASAGSNILTLTNPNGGESWHEGDARTITWVTSGDIESNKVKIGLSFDSGLTWSNLQGTQTIDNLSACLDPISNSYYTCPYGFDDWPTNDNTGETTWTIPGRTNNSINTLIGIWSAAKPAAYYDVNDAYFTITADSNFYQILYPNGGEQVQMGSTLPILWESGGNVGNVELYYSEYSGDNWYLIDDNENNDGSYTWTVPTLQSENSNILIKIVDRSNDTWFDISDATFTITETVNESYDMDFESSESTSGWTFGGGWTINSDDAYSGSKSAYRETISSDNNEHILSITNTSSNAGVLSFYYKSNFRYSSSYLKFKVDDVEKFTTSSNRSSWGVVELWVDSGTHTYEWIHKDAGSINYFARIDAISFPD